MADGDYERREPKAAELKRLERMIAEARLRQSRGGCGSALSDQTRPSTDTPS